MSSGPYKVSLVAQVMRRTVIAGLALCVMLPLLALVQSGSANAQSGPVCTRFGAAPAGLDGWGACPAAPNIVVTTSNVQSIGGAGDYYLHLTDLSGASAACSSSAQYTGNWIQKMGGCGQFCFDFRLFVEDNGFVTPQFTIWSGTQSATFVANFTVTIAQGWKQNICAPINLIQAGDPLPSNGMGKWIISGSNNYNAAWNSIVQNVTTVQVPVDFTSDPNEQMGYDNICMNPGACPGGNTTGTVTGCLSNATVTVSCNANGTYTLTLSGVTFTGTDISLASQTAGVTVSPAQQPWAATTTWTITGATSGETVVLTANATNAGGGTAPGSDQCCSGQITVVMPYCPKQAGEVIVEKKVKNDTRASTAVINSLVFPIGLSCTAPSNLNVSFGLNNSGTHTENNVPYTSVCSVTESVSTLPAVPKDVCGEGSTAVWSPPVITVAPSATIGAPVTTFTVLNELKCEKVGSLIVQKQVIYDGPVTLPSQIYPVTVNCGGTITQLNLLNGVSQTVNNIPLGTGCSVVEGPVSTPPNICRLPTTPVWSTTYVPPSPITITGMGITELVKNTLTCRARANTCPPPQVVDAAGVCVCPEGTVLVDGKCVTQPKCPPPHVVNPATGQCICPEGTVPRGNECVRPIVCKPPQVPNPTGTACICPEGTVLRGNECVRPIVCKPPQVANPAGTACECPPGTVLRGNECVRPIVCRPPQIANPAGTACECPQGTVLRGNECMRSGTGGGPAGGGAQPGGGGRRF